MKVFIRISVLSFIALMFISAFAWPIQGDIFRDLNGSGTTLANGGTGSVIIAKPRMVSDSSFSCPGNLVANGGFSSGLVPGYIPNGGSVNNWTSVSYGSYTLALPAGGCDTGDVGSLGMLGRNDINFLSSIQQTLASGFVAGMTYSISMCVRNPPPPPNEASIAALMPYVRFRFQSSAGGAGNATDGELIGETGQVTSANWTTVTLPNWTCQTSASVLTISAFNDGGGVYPFDTSYGEIDRICISVVVPDSGAISGAKWNDLNGNGIRDPGEPGLPNWTITITGPVNDTTTTNGSGNYHFSPLPPGTYTVCEVLQAGWSPTTQECRTVTLTAGQIDTILFGNHVDTTSYSCAGDLIANPDFKIGLTPGQLNVTGHFDQWQRDPYSSAYELALQAGGCDSGNFGSAGLLGSGQGILGAIEQTLTSGFVAGTTYSISMCVRRPAIPPPFDFIQAPLSNIQFRLHSSNGSINSPTDGEIIGETGQISSSNWTTVTLPNWTCQNNGSIFTISAFNTGGGVYSVDTSYGEIDRVCITLAPLDTLPVRLRENWNMISVPLAASNFHKSILYPTASSNAFGYQGSYVIDTLLSNGIGYWLKFDSAQNISLTGWLLTDDTVTVNPGWNMIGSISVPIPTDQITSVPGGLVTSQFFAYKGRYITSDTIFPGNGYWVKVDSGGKLALDTSSSAALPIAVSRKNGTRIKIMSLNEMPPPPPETESNGSFPQLPKAFALEQNYPNPFNPTTILRYALPTDSRVLLTVYNVLGQVVATLENGIVSAGYQSAQWNASNVASGVYFYRLEATSISNPSKTFTQVKKMVLMK